MDIDYGHELDRKKAGAVEWIIFPQKSLIASLLNKNGFFVL